MLQYRRRERENRPGEARFLTFSCFHQLNLFKNPKIKDRFVMRLAMVTAKHRADVLAWVVMDDHVHLVLMPSDDRYCITNVLHNLKTPFAREIINRWKHLKAPILGRVVDGDIHHFWQEGGGYDRNVVGDELLEKIHYVHANPVTAGLSATSVEYPWSSAAAFERLPYVGPPIAFHLIPPTDRPLT